MRKQKAWIGVFVLLAANTAAAGAEWCTSALATISSNFPDVPYSVITLINNIPNLCAIVFAILAGFLVGRKIKLKTMMVTAISLFVVGGTLPAITATSNIYLVLVERLIFGIGYGTMQGICVSMSYKLITNKGLRTHAMGWTQSAQYGINMIAQVAVGILAATKWNYSFFAYLWGLIPLVIVIIFCPDFPLNKDAEAIEGTPRLGDEPLFKSIKNLPGSVWAFSIFVALFLMCVYPFLLNVSTIIVANGYGNSVQAGTAMVFFSIGTIIGGIFFGPYAKLAKNFTLFGYMLLVALCFILTLFVNSYAAFCAILFVCGLGITGPIPSCMNAYSSHVPENRFFIASGITMAGVNLGAFLATPYIAIYEAAGNTSPTATLIPSACILVVMGIISVVLLKKAGKKNAAEAA